MALYPNGSYMSRSPGRHFGGATAAVGGTSAGLGVLLRNDGARMNRFVNASFSRTASTPDGYGIRSPWPAIKVGGLSGVGRITLTTAGNLLSGGPMTGSGAISLAANTPSLGLIARMSGSGSWSLVKGTAAMSGVVKMTGSGSFSLTKGVANLGMIVPMSGSGGFGIAGYGDIRMRLSMSGGWTPFSTLSPEGLAAAVWQANASTYNDAGTMGEKLNGAGSAGNPWTEVIESGLTAAQVMRIIAAALAGTSQKTGTTIVFKGLDGSTDRITGEFDTDGNRTGTVLDGN